MCRYFDPLKSDLQSRIYNIEIQDDLASYLVLLSSEDVLHVKQGDGDIQNQSTHRGVSGRDSQFLPERKEEWKWGEWEVFSSHQREREMEVGR